LNSSQLATSTRQLYRAAARIYLIPTLGEVRMGELTVASIHRVPRCFCFRRDAAAITRWERALVSCQVPPPTRQIGSGR
jgi:hypothetical protein